jgi:hypothetical protein
VAGCNHWQGRDWRAGFVLGRSHACHDGSDQQHNTGIEQDRQEAELSDTSKALHGDSVPTSIEKHFPSLYLYTHFSPGQREHELCAILLSRSCKSISDPMCSFVWDTGDCLPHRRGRNSVTDHSNQLHCACAESGAWHESGGQWEVSKSHSHRAPSSAPLPSIFFEYLFLIERATGCYLRSILSLFLSSKGKAYR